MLQSVSLDDIQLSKFDAPSSQCPLTATSEIMDSLNNLQMHINSIGLNANAPRVDQGLRKSDVNLNVLNNSNRQPTHTHSISMNYTKPVVKPVYSHSHYDYQPNASEYRKVNQGLFD